MSQAAVDRGAGASLAAELNPRHSLRPGSLRFLGTVGNAIGIQAPTAGVTFLPALMAGVVGGSGPLAFLLALVAMLFVAFAFLVFTRDVASAGSIYTFNGLALGRRAGAVFGILLAGVYLAYAASVYASNANFVQGLFPGSPVPWPVIAAMFWALTLVLTYRRVGLSSGLIVLLELVSLCLVAVVVVAVLGKGGAHPGAITAKPFTVNGLPFATLGLGVVLAFTGFSGFEVAATFGEEARLPRRVIPASVVTALLVSGGVYVFMSWLETIAFASPQALAANAVPLVTIAGHYVSTTMGTVINIAALISGIGAQFACVNGATRLLFAFGRTGVAPRWFDRTHPLHRSPVAALAVAGVLSLVATLAMWRASAIDAYFYLATYGADLVLVVYLAAVVGAAVWSFRRGHRGPVRYIALGIGAVILGYIIKNTVYPVPAFPFNWCIYAAAATILFAALLVLVRPGDKLRTGAATAPASGS